MVERSAGGYVPNGLQPNANVSALAAGGLLIASGLLFSLTPGPVIASGLALIVISHLLWTPERPPILLLPVLFQWSEVAAWPVATLWNGKSLNEMSLSGSADLEASAYFGFLGVVALSLGLRIGAGQLQRQTLAITLEADARAIPFMTVLRIGLGAIAAGYFFAAAAQFAGPAREPVYQLGNIKYLGLFLIMYHALIVRSNQSVALAIVLFDTVVGLTGFFAEFKNTVLVLLVAAMAARRKLDVRDVAWVFGAATLVLTVALFWTIVKPGYREFANQGTGDHAASAPLEDRVNYLLKAGANIDMAAVGDGFDALIRRHGYIEYLGMVMDFVPERRPHENGDLTLKVLQHILLPRFLFPEKDALPSDTDITIAYTGMSSENTATTSISIGNLGEMYIDFGFAGALLVQLVLGIAIGFATRKLFEGDAPPLLSAGLCLMVVLPWAYFGTAYVKLVGAGVYSLIITFGIKQYILPSIVAREWRRRA